MSEEEIIRVLTSSALTEKEAEIYVFLAKHDAMKAREIAKLMGKDKSQVYHILKEIQAKGFVDATNEFPTHFTAVPFENVINSIIGAKKKEVASIQESKDKLLDYLKRRRVESGPFLEKFMVIKGYKDSYARISKMILDARHELLAATTVSGLLRADRFGAFDVAFNHPLKSQVHYRFLTELSAQNLKTMRDILKRAPKTNFRLKARSPDLGVNLFPRMVVRDGEELLFFITPITGSAERDDLCLWTNCKSLVQSFTVVFEGFWADSRDVNERLVELETGKPISAAYVISDARLALKTYNEVMGSVEEEVIMVTSAKGLMESWKNISLLKEWSERGVSVRIMAPITHDNVQVAHELSKCCAVRHVPASISNIVVVDGKHLFQFQAVSNQEPAVTPYFYTDNFEYVEKTRNMLNNVWRTASLLSSVTLDSIINPFVSAAATPVPASEYSWSRPEGAYQKMNHYVKEQGGAITEKEVLAMIINAKRYPAKNWPKEVIRLYGSSGNAVIHPPASFNLPDMLIWFVHENKQSSFGVTDRLFVYLWLETPKGYAYVPVASVTDNPSNVEFEKIRFANSPAGQNVQLLGKDDLQVRIHGNTAFAGWTKPIPLVPSKYTLPPSCILLEGYSRLKSVVIDYHLPSGVKTHIDSNGFDAFVTFFHPASKYSGPGTDGTIGRDIVVTIRPP